MEPVFAHPVLNAELAYAQGRAVTACHLKLAANLLALNPEHRSLDTAGQAIENLPKSLREVAALYGEATGGSLQGSLLLWCWHRSLASC